MTAESKELYNYVTGVEPFCSEVSELQAKKESLSYNNAEKILINITERADRQYTKDYCTKKSCFTEFNYYEIMYRILCEMCNFDTSTEKSGEQKIREYLDEIYEESTILPESFGNNILQKLKVRFSEDGYEITKKTVLEEMLWCYMCRMQ